MLAAMEQQSNATTAESEKNNGTNNSGTSSSSSSNSNNNTKVETEQFYSSGRTGRRNALADILCEHAHVTSSDLPARLQALTTTESDKLNRPEDEAGPSGQK